MVSERIQELMNQLIQMELTSSHLYLALSSYFHRLSLIGLERWSVVQSQEKVRNAHRLVVYLNDRDGTVEIRAVPAQPTTFGTPVEVYQRVYVHEEGVTNAYEQAYANAFEAGDFQTSTFLEDFIREQTEVVAVAKVILGRMQVGGMDPAGILLLDRELGHRHWSRTRHSRDRRSGRSRKQLSEEPF
ncbi:MAG TPA: ferritin [Symbiobacteriaceae bacterium]|nr:ferritin [Symbiobacteriaceae bacterium]